jgi:hypothetical protein
MIYIKNKYYPFKNYIAITHWPFVFYKKLGVNTKNHEAIHGEQQKELLIVVFYLIYFIEWVFKEYKNISFEKEAYANEKDTDYLEKRKRFNWIKYL